MFEEPVFNMTVILIALAALIFGSITDLKKREVPDWLNFSLISMGFGVRLIFSVVYNDYHVFLHGVYGFLLFTGLAYIMYYTGQWGGGDSKMLMGLGALLGLTFSWDSAAVNFLIYALILGAIYGMLWSFFVTFRNRKAFIKEFTSRLHDRQTLKIRIYLIIIAAVLVAGSFFTLPLIRILIFSMVAAGFLTFYLWIFIKSVEKSCMHKYVDPEDLTEGDWIVEDVKINGKHICGPKDLGIQMKQIRELIKFKKENKIKKVLIKEGIPFVPSFLFGFIALLVFGSLIGHFFP